MYPACIKYSIKQSIKLSNASLNIAVGLLV